MPEVRCESGARRGRCSPRRGPCAWNDGIRIHPDELRRIVRQTIDLHVVKDKLAVLLIAEESERELLNGLGGIGR